ARADVFETALDLAGEALRADDHAAAEDLLKAAEGAAKKLGGADLIAVVTRHRQEVGPLKETFQKVKTQAEKLKDEPKDPEANLAVGRYYALVREEWDRALPHLGAGGADDWKGAAQKDLAQPKGSKAQVGVGDLWWDLAAKEKGAAQGALRRR